MEKIMKNLTAYNNHIVETPEICRFKPCFLRITGPMKRLDTPFISEKADDYIYLLQAARNPFARQTMYYLERQSAKCLEYEWDDLLYNIDMKSEPRLNLSCTHALCIDNVSIQWCIKDM